MYLTIPTIFLGFPGGSEVKASACNVGDLGSIPGLGRSPGGGNSNPFQYYCLKNPMDGGAWWVHGVAKIRTGLSDFTFTFAIFLQCAQSFSCGWLFAIQWTVAHKAPLPMGFSRQEYWNGLPFPTPGGLLDPGIKPMSPASLHWQADSLPLHHLGSPIFFIKNTINVAFFFFFSVYASKQILSILCWKFW